MQFQCQISALEFFTSLIAIREATAPREHEVFDPPEHRRAEFGGFEHARRAIAHGDVRRVATAGIHLLLGQPRVERVDELDQPVDFLAPRLKLPVQVDARGFSTAAEALEAHQERGGTHRRARIAQALAIGGDVRVAIGYGLMPVGRSEQGVAQLGHQAGALERGRQCLADLGRRQNHEQQSRFACHRLVLLKATSKGRDHRRSRRVHQALRRASWRCAARTRRCAGRPRDRSARPSRLLRHRAHCASS